MVHINQQDNKNRTILHHLFNQHHNTTNNNFKKIKNIFKKYKDEIDINIRCNKGYTLLIICSIKRNKKLMRLLIENFKDEIDVNINDEMQNTALFYAIHHNSSSLVKLILKNFYDTIYYDHELFDFAFGLNYSEICIHFAKYLHDNVSLSDISFSSIFQNLHEAEAIKLVIELLVKYNLPVSLDSNLLRYIYDNANLLIKQVLDDVIIKKIVDCDESIDYICRNILLIGSTKAVQYLLDANNNSSNKIFTDGCTLRYLLKERNHQTMKLLVDRFDIDIQNQCCHSDSNMWMNFFPLISMRICLKFYYLYCYIVINPKILVVLLHYTLLIYIKIDYHIFLLKL